jgi:hypothetical protein
LNQLFWLVFKQGNGVAVFIQPAGDLITARMRVALAGMDGEFHELDAKIAKRMAKDQIGKILSRKQATALLKRLDR